MGETPPLLIVRREGFATSGVMHRSLGGKDSPLQMGRREVVCNIWSHALEFGWVRLLPLLMIRREVGCNICSHALEFGWVRLPLCQWAGEKWFATSVVIHWSLGEQDSPLANGKEEVVCNICSHALEFG